MRSTDGFEFFPVTTILWEEIVGDELRVYPENTFLALILGFIATFITLPCDLFFLVIIGMGVIFNGALSMFNKAYTDIKNSESPKKSVLTPSSRAQWINNLSDTLLPLFHLRKDFVDSFKPYKYDAKFELTRIALQPIYGSVNLARGIYSVGEFVYGVGKFIFLALSIIGSSTQDQVTNKLIQLQSTLAELSKHLYNGALNIVRGALQVVCTPLSWTIRPLLRLGISYSISADEKPAIFNNRGIQERLNFIKRDDVSEQEREEARAEVAAKVTKALQRGEAPGKYGAEYKRWFVMNDQAKEKADEAKEPDLPREAAASR